jgi:hypothetical protein
LVATGGPGDQQVALWDATKLTEVRRFEVGCGVVGLVAFAEDAVGVFDAAGNLTRWRLDGHPLGPPVPLAARSWAAIGLAATIAQQRSARAAEQEEQLQRLERAVQERKLAAHRADIDLLERAGRQEWALFAALEAREANRNLDELALWIRIEQVVGALPPAWAYLAAENRYTLLDFCGAELRFRSAGEFSDAAIRAEACRTRLSVSDMVRGDVRQPGQVVEEAARATLLGERMKSPIVVWAPEPKPMSGPLDTDYVLRRVEDLAAIHGRRLRVIQERRTVWTGQDAVDVRWVRVFAESDGSPTGFASIAAGQPEIGQQWALYCLFEPRAGHGDVRDHNAAVVAAWSDFIANPKVRAWMDETAPLLQKAVEEARNRSAAAPPGRDRSGF